MNNYTYVFFQSLYWLANPLKMNDLLILCISLFLANIFAQDAHLHVSQKRSIKCQKVWNLMCFQLLCMNSVPSDAHEGATTEFKRCIGDMLVISFAFRPSVKFIFNKCNFESFLPGKHSKWMICCRQWRRWRESRILQGNGSASVECPFSAGWFLGTKVPEKLY